MIYLKEEGDDGKVVIESEMKARINNQPVLDKISDIGSANIKEKLLGEIMYGQDSVKITNKHIILLDSNMQIKQVFENRNIQNFIYADKVWVYALSNRREAYDNKL